MVYAFIFLVSVLCSSIQASNRVFNEDTFSDAHWRLEVSSPAARTLHIHVSEGKETLLEQTVTIGQRDSVQTPTCSLAPSRNGFRLSYIGLDGTSLKANIDANATIDVLGSGSGIINTGFSRSKSWGFKTSGIWRNKEGNLSAFYNLITEAKEFHNLGILQVTTGHFTQDYQFNKGVFHMGLTRNQVGVSPYATYEAWLENKATPRFQTGIAENYGVILAEAGLKVRRLSFNDYGYAHLDFLDLEDAPLNIEREAEQKVPLMEGTPQPVVQIEETIVGRTPRVRVASNSFLSMGQVGSSLSVQDWTNQGLIQTIRDSEFAPTRNWDNQGQILSHGNVTINNRTRPRSLGAVISSGAIRALISDALSAAESEQALRTSRFASLNNQVIIDVVHHIDHYLNTITRHHRNGRFTHQTETGYVFQRRETTRTQKAVPGGSVTEEGKAQIQAMRRQHFARQAVLNHLKDALRHIGRACGEQAGLLGMILQGLREAGLSADEIQALVDDAEIGNTLMGLAMIDSVRPSSLSELISQQTDSSQALNHFYTQASRAGMRVLDWVKRSGPEFIGHFCDLANLLTLRGVEHPLVVGSAAVCNTGRFAKTTYSAFRRAEAFFNRQHDGGRRTGGSGSGITAGSGGSSSSSSSTSQQQGPQRAFPGTHQPHKAPKTLPAFPQAKEAPRKTFVHGGGGMRKRWKDDNYIYEWDYRHGRVEKYDKRGKKHLGEFDAQTGQQLKPGNPSKPPIEP